MVLIIIEFRRITRKEKKKIEIMKKKIRGGEMRGEN